LKKKTPARNFARRPPYFNFSVLSPFCLQHRHGFCRERLLVVPGSKFKQRVFQHGPTVDNFQKQLVPVRL